MAAQRRPLRAAIPLALGVVLTDNTLLVTRRSLLGQASGDKVGFFAPVALRSVLLTPLK